MEVDLERRNLLDAYIECFNRRDWEALERLVQADARVDLVGVTEGGLAAVRLWWRDDKVVRIRDFVHVDYFLRYSRTEVENSAASHRELAE